MATKKPQKSVASKIRDSLQQYSKKMCTRVTIFWMIYRIAISALIFLKPEVSNALIRLTEGVDTAMIINMSVYTVNSSTEKIAIAYFGKKFKDSLEESDADTTAQEERLAEVVEEGIQNG